MLLIQWLWGIHVHLIYMYRMYIYTASGMYHSLSYVHYLTTDFLFLLLRRKFRTCKSRGRGKSGRLGRGRGKSGRLSRGRGKTGRLDRGSGGVRGEDESKEA